MESIFQRNWRHENATIKFTPADANQPRLGGSVAVRVMGFDYCTFMPFSKTYHGIYSEDMMTYGEYKSGVPQTDEDLLMIMDEECNEVVDQHTFRFSDDGKVSYERIIDSNVKDAEIEHAIEEGQLDADINQSWTETLFYGVGNKAV